MGLFDRIQRLLSRGPPKKVEDGSFGKLEAMVIPSAHLGRGVYPDEGGADFYSNFFGMLEEHAKEVYGNYDAHRESLGPGHKLRVEVSGGNISYRASPQSAGVYMGMLAMEGKPGSSFDWKIFFERCLEQDALLACKSGDPDSFMVFYTSSDGNVLKKRDALNSLGLNPRKGCEYLVVPGAVGWNYVDFDT